MSFFLYNNPLFPRFNLNDTIIYNNLDPPLKIYPKSHHNSSSTQMGETKYHTEHIETEIIKEIFSPKKSEFKKKKKKGNRKMITNFSQDHFQMYLRHVNDLNQSKNLKKEQTGRFMEQMKRKFENDMPKKKNVKRVTLLPELKFKKIEDEDDIPKNMKHQILYEQENRSSIQNISRNIEKLSDLLNRLKDYLNNSRKLFFVIKKLIGLRKNLYKLLIQSESEELLIDPINEPNIEKRCKFKESIFDAGDVILIDKFDFNLNYDIIYLTDRVQNMLREIKFSKVIQIERKIVQEYEGINQLEYKLKKPVKVIKARDLRFSTNAMNLYHPHEELVPIETKLGELDRVDNDTKLMSQLIGDITKRCNEMSIE